VKGYLKERAGSDEHSPAFGRYLARVKDGDITEILEAQGREFESVFQELPSGREDFRYAPEKWTIRELLGHVIDAERVFSWRALAIGRGDPAPLPGFDETIYSAGAETAAVPWSELIEEFHVVRRASVLLYSHMPEAGFRRRGTANGLPTSVRALAGVTAGHAAHHLAILRERYLART
jgi:hypothetical protein